MTLAKQVDFPLSRPARTFDPILPPRSAHPFLGAVITPLRRAAWKLFGLYPAFERSNDQMITAMRLALEVSPFFHFRPGTNDLGIFQYVVIKNEYELPESFHPDDIILDVGAHIGSFCYAALRRGCQHVHAFEANRNNYEAAAANLRNFHDRVHLRHCAVWRSDREGDQLFADEAAGYNTGGGSLLFNQNGQKMEVRAFDDILRDITHAGKQRIRLLKIDCEGAEFPILLTSKLLSLIDEIRGEYHEINDGVRNHQSIPAIARVAGVERFTMSVLAEALAKAGFSVQSTRTDDEPLGHFVATRRM
ncbi:MAG: FkbM family methyltransferase [Gemmataceae bacterium]